MVCVCVGLHGRADTILFWASQCFGKKKKREKKEKKNVLIANYVQYLPEQYFPNWPSSLQYIHLIKFWATTKASINKDICLHCPLMAFKRSVMEGSSAQEREHIHAAACADGERTHKACADSQKCSPLNVAKAANKELWSAESTCRGRKIFAVFTCGSFARALPHLRSQVCRG